MEPPRAVRLHTNENPHGPSPTVAAAIAAEAARVHRYPDGDAHELVEAIAVHHGVDTDQISVGNGVDEVILLLTMALRAPGVTAVVTDGTFRSYHESLAALSDDADLLPLDGYQVPVAAIADRLRRGSCYAFVCNPHNPAGTTLSRSDVADLVAAAEEGGSTVVLDEAYAEYAGPGFATALPHVQRGGPVCVLRTFAKAYGLAGLRVGYLVGQPELVARVNALHRPLPYHVNRMAQAAAIAALADQDHLWRTTEETTATRDWFAAELAAAGMPAVASSANFVLVPVPDPAAARAALQLRGFLVRDTTGMGLPHHLRVAIGTREEMTALLAALTGAVSRTVAA
ncbi:pyridoxal phosphate-dependent aminotransferase [Actinokineospora guangxiensis]|uniref:histidinol-phosphate transaminase n=1 Tax=Actinokineospora guangxiensis TaxID=1490288 RepID=A0ABW0ERX4_9PSEU